MPIAFDYRTPLPVWFTSISSQGYLEDFVLQLDVTATAATVTALSPGRSGAAVFLVRRVSDGQTLVPLVLKMAADSKSLRKERDNYNAYVRDRLANAPSLHEPTGEHILAYTYTGTLLAAPLTIREGYSRSNSSTLTQLIDHLVEVLVSWYVTSNHAHTNVEDMEQFNPPLGTVLESLGTDFEQYLFLNDWWEEFQKHGPAHSVQRVYRCHGDLNAGNVMFDGHSIDPIPFIIDFGSVDERIAHWDFAKLDRDLKTRLYLGDARRDGRSYEDMARVVQDVDSSDESEQAATRVEDASPEQKLSACIQALRTKVRYMDGRYLYERAYYQSLLFATLSILYRKDPDPEDTANIQKRLACVSATALLSRLLQRSIPSAVDFAREKPTLSAPIETHDDGFVGVPRLHLQAGRLVQTICERVQRSINGEVRFVGVTAHALLMDPSFIEALEDQPGRERPITLHVYVMRADTDCFREFHQRSAEPADVLREKLGLTRKALETLAHSDRHQQLRMVLYEYDALPTINLIQIDNEFLLRPYKYGQQLTFLDVYHIVRNGQNEDIELWLANILSDLTLRSNVHTLKWNSSSSAPWPR